MYKWQSVLETNPKYKSEKKKYSGDKWVIADQRKHPFIDSISLETNNPYDGEQPFSVAILSSTPTENGAIELKNILLKKGGEELEKLGIACCEYEKGAVRLSRDDENKGDLVIFLHVIAEVAGVDEKELNKMKVFLGLSLELIKKPQNEWQSNQVISSDEEWFESANIPTIYDSIKDANDKKTLLETFKQARQTYDFSTQTKVFHLLCGSELSDQKRIEFGIEDNDTFLSLAELLNSMRLQLKEKDALLQSKDAELTKVKAELEKEKLKNITKTMAETGFLASNTNNQEESQDLDLSLGTIIP